MKRFIAVFSGLMLILSGCGSDAEPADNKKEEAPKDEKAERIKELEEAFKSHKSSVEKMNNAKENAEKGDDAKAKDFIKAASMLNDAAQSEVGDIEIPDRVTDEESGFFIYQSSIKKELEIYGAAIDGAQGLVDEGVPVQMAFDDFYDKKTGPELKKLEELEGKLKNFK